MAKKMFWLGILVMALVFGMMSVGCASTGGGGGSTAGNTATTNNPVEPIRKSVKIENITGLTGNPGVWVFAELPSGGRLPANTAIQWGTISRGNLQVNLVVPRDNTWNTTTNGQPNARWTGSGDFYVALIPSDGRSFDYPKARIFTDGGDTPVKVSFTEALTTLDFSKFRNLN